MRFLTWLRSEDRSDPTERRRRPGPSRGRATVRPRLEMLVERRVLSTLTVTSGHDGDGGCLRDEIAKAQPGYTIVFDTSLDGQTITLLGFGQLEINKNLTIQGPGAGLLAISGGRSRVFAVDTGANVTFSGLTIEGGGGVAAWTPPGSNTDGTPSDYDGYGGGILNLGTLTLSSCNVTGNTTGTQPKGPNPYTSYQSAGGGIYNHGMMTLSGCNVTGNAAYPIPTVYGTTWPSAGGGIFNDSQGHLTIVSSVVKNNTASDGADICDLGSMTISKDSEIGSKVSHK
jgi:hypothetical protein